MLLNWDELVSKVETLFFKVSDSLWIIDKLFSNSAVLVSRVEVLVFKATTLLFKSEALFSKVDVVCFNSDISLSKLLVLSLTSLTAKTIFLEAVFNVLSSLGCKWLISTDSTELEDPPVETFGLKNPIIPPP